MGPANCDISVSQLHPSASGWTSARLGPDFGRAGQAAWVESYATRAFAGALVAQPEFFDHVREVWKGTWAVDVAKRYVPRAQGLRVQAVAVFLVRAAAGPTDALASLRLQNFAPAWWGDAPLEPGQPARNLRSEQIEKLKLGALRTARRGARRCVRPGCANGLGARLTHSGDHCDPCAAGLREWEANDFVKTDKVFFDDLVAAVVPGARSRARARRLRRAA